MTEPRYGDPAALRQALTDQLRRLALARPGAQLADLQRQFAYDRLLGRVFVVEPEAWVVKGATALLARMHGSERDLETALTTVRRFLDRVLDGTAAGTWDPHALTWSG